MEMVLIDYILFILLLLVFFGGPIYLWMRWIAHSRKNKNKFGQIVSISSLTLFISAIILMWFGPTEIFEPHTIRVTMTGVYVFYLFLLSISIPAIYFSIRLIYYVFRKSTQEIVFRPSSLPYIFQYEKHNAAWTKERSGYFIFPNGIIYDYYFSPKLNFNEDYLNNQNTKSSEMVEDYKMEEEVIPDILYNCIARSSKSWFSKLNSSKTINTTILDQLINSELEYVQMGCDMGMETKFIWIYNTKTLKYNRITLIGEGDYSVLNKSSETKLALSYF
jgi:hypothetical protein